MNFTFKIGQKIKEAWPLYKEHFGALLLMTLLTFAVAGVGQKEDFALSIIVTIVNIVLSYIWIRLILSLIDKKEFNLFSKDLPTLGQLWNFIKTSILYGLCVIGGLILLIVPGFYFAGRLMFAVYISVEKNQGARLSIKESWEMTRSYGWKLFWKSFVIALFMAVGFLALFVGSFITYPIGFMLMIMMYREFIKFKSQNISASSTAPSPLPVEATKEEPAMATVNNQ